MSEQKHPSQPLVADKYGTVRFKENHIVRKLLDEGPFDMNQIEMWDVSREDRVQFAQLIGYSLDGFGELQSYVRDEDYMAAVLMFREGRDERDARNADLTRRLKALRDGLRPLVAELYGIHPDDLGDGA